MEIPLRYGRADLVIRVPPDRVAAVVRPAADRPTARIPPGKVEDVRERVRRRRALLLIPDGTRRASTEALDTAFAALAPCASLSVVVATGSHRTGTPANRRIVDEVRSRAAAHRAPSPEVEIHDCRSADFRDSGTTPRGNPLRLSARLVGPDVVLVVSDVKHHYFAGYSNPLKFFLPGLADFATIEANHRFALEDDAAAGRHPLHPDPARRSNPVAEEMLEAFRQVWGNRDAYALVQVESRGRIVHAELDELTVATSRALAAADEVAGVRVSPSRHVVISAGGLPQDGTLYLCQRAVELSKPAIADGAEVLLLAECRDGIADTDAAYRNFYVELTRPLEEILARIRGGYRLYQHKAYRFAQLLRRIRSLHLVSRLDDEDVRAAHFEPAASAQDLVDRWIEADPACRITFLDEANRLAVLGGES